MDRQPLVSILIPNYNKAPFLRETLDSVLGQSYKNWECIIIDDHSTDESWEILLEYAKKDSRFQVFKRPYHLPKGGNVCRNYAFELSVGEYVNWFDSDDLMFRDCIFNRVSLLKQSKFDVIVNPKIGYVSNSIESFSDNNDLSHKYIIDFFFLKSPWLGQSMMLKKSYLVNNNIKWKPKLTYHQDVYYILDVLKFASIGELFNVDWSWRSNSSYHLGYLSDRINSYKVNNLQVSTHFDSLSLHYFGIKKNDLFNWYCYKRVWDIFKINSLNETNIFPLIPYFLGPIKYRSINIINGLMNLFLFACIVCLIPFNSRISLSLMYRTTKRFHNKKYNYFF
ncbi:glycosyltransferase family 2 protein [Algoriphagus sp. PAP.12]|uniref:glycosyltransferase family 2 protein n=1 Tax=Algoriphagus sp. PAP.12 TaxID=2996678 RepID=UPI00227AE828|nr:glycosyltransferase family 2 protein [Algoriphagus sp. PAP.12]